MTRLSVNCQKTLQFTRLHSSYFVFNSRAIKLILQGQSEYRAWRDWGPHMSRHFQNGFLKANTHHMAVHVRHAHVGVHRTQIVYLSAKLRNKPRLTLYIMYVIIKETKMMMQGNFTALHRYFYDRMSMSVHVCLMIDGTTSTPLVYKLKSLHSLIKHS